MGENKRCNRSTAVCLRSRLDILWKQKEKALVSVQQSIKQHGMHHPRRCSRSKGIHKNHKDSVQWSRYAVSGRASRLSGACADRRPASVSHLAASSSLWRFHWPCAMEPSETRGGNRVTKNKHMQWMADARRPAARVQLRGRRSTASATLAVTEPVAAFIKTLASAVACEIYDAYHPPPPFLIFFSCRIRREWSQASPSTQLN